MSKKTNTDGERWILRPSQIEGNPANFQIPNSLRCQFDLGREIFASRSSFDSHTVLFTHKRGIVICVFKDDLVHCLRLVRHGEYVVGACFALRDAVVTTTRTELRVILAESSDLSDLRLVRAQWYTCASHDLRHADSDPEVIAVPPEALPHLPKPSRLRNLSLAFVLIHGNDVTIFGFGQSAQPIPSTGKRRHSNPRWRDGFEVTEIYRLSIPGLRSCFSTALGLVLQDAQRCEVRPWVNLTTATLQHTFSDASGCVIVLDEFPVIFENESFVYMTDQQGENILPHSCHGGVGMESVGRFGEDIGFTSGAELTVCSHRSFQPTLRLDTQAEFGLNHFIMDFVKLDDTFASMLIEQTNPHNLQRRKILQVHNLGGVVDEGDESSSSDI